MADTRAARGKKRSVQPVTPAGNEARSRGTNATASARNRRVIDRSRSARPERPEQALRDMDTDDEQEENEESNKDQREPDSVTGAQGDCEYPLDVDDLMVDFEESDNEQREASTGTRKNLLRDVDTSGLSAEEAKKKVEKVKKERAREYRNRYRSRQLAAVSDAEPEHLQQFTIKSLQGVESECEGGASNYIQVGNAYDTKAMLYHEICEMAENLCLTVNFPRNTRVELSCVSDDFHGIQPRPFLLQARFRLTEKRWVVTKVVLSGAMGLGPQVIEGQVDQNWRKGLPKTAFTEDQLAWHVRDAICRKPSLSRTSLVALLTPYLRFPNHITGDVWSRVRRKAYNYAFGTPDDNMSKLPQLKAEMEKYGHDLEYDTCDGRMMVACVLSVKKAECDRRREKARKVNESNRTEDHIADLRPWSQQLAEFRQTHSQFLTSISAPGLKYVNYLAFAFSFVRGQFVMLLKYISADACFGKLHLDSFQIFGVCGVTANGNVVSLGYVLISGNESEETWTRAWRFYRSKFPSMNATITAVSDGDKGIPKGLHNAFPEDDRPFEFRCSRHRSENLRLRNGRAAQTEFWRCVHAKTLVKLSSIRSSSTFQEMSETARVALNSLPDERQFPAAAAACGASLYGRDSNQLSETENSAIAPARSLDPFLFVLWHCKRSVRLYSKFYQESRACDSTLTPYAQKKLQDIKKVGEVQPIIAEFTPSHQVFHVRVGQAVNQVYLRVPSADDTNQSRFPYDRTPCTCGAPAIEHMPCGHMLAVAEKISLNSVYMVPSEFTTAAWVAQYPDVDVYAPCYDDVLASSVPKDLSLKNPVAAPPKRGRPAKRRMRGVMERVVKRARQNRGN